MNQKQIINNEENISKDNSLNNISNYSEMNNEIVLKLIEFGYNSIYSKRIFVYFQPENIEEALDYLLIENGIINHNFVQDRDPKSNLCYLCGERKEIHFGFNPNDNSINNSDSNKISINSYISNIENNKKTNIEIKNSSPIKKIKCEICDESFISNKENTIKECGHSFCNSCWYDYLSIKIEENKISSIKCLDYNCPEKISDKFIINLLKNNEKLIKKYKKYKLELEVMSNPNKKLCPFPNCNSFLELKDEKIKYIKCKNNNYYCFLCLQNPHGKLPCNVQIDKNIKEFAKNHFIKKCPQCGVITEKESGCNHITCIKCNYQWCWLCNEKYEEGHFDEGKCQGYQFFNPKDEYEIKLAFEGKIELSHSQQQSDIDYDNFGIQNQQQFDIDIINFEERNINNENNIRIRELERDTHNINVEYFDRNHPEHNIVKIINERNIVDSEREIQNIESKKNNINDFEKYNCLKKFFIFFKYLIIGNGYLIILIFYNHYERFCLAFKLIYILTYLMSEIAYFFLHLYINIIMLIPYIIKVGFSRIIYEIDKGKNDYIILIQEPIIIYTCYIFVGGIFLNLRIIEYIGGKNRNHEYPFCIEILLNFIDYFIEISLFLIHFPKYFIIEIIYIFILLLKKENVHNKIGDVIDLSISF